MFAPYADLVDSTLDEPKIGPIDPGASRPRWWIPAVTAVVLSMVLALGVLAMLLSHRAQSAPVAITSITGTSPAASLTPSALPGGPISSFTSNLPAAEPVLVAGDSLALTVYPWLASLLPDRYVSYAAEVGRSTAWTVSRLQSLEDSGTVIPRVVIVSAGTNDQSASDFARDSVALIKLLGTDRCIIWSDIVRPAAYGDDPAPLNAALAQIAAQHHNVHVLAWSKLLASNPEWISSDGIHPRDLGAQGRAAAFADSAHACSAADPYAPRARRQFLPREIFTGPISGTGGSGSSTGSPGSSRTGTDTSGSSPSRSSTSSSSTSSSSTFSSSTSSPAGSDTSSASAGSSSSTATPGPSSPQPTGHSSSPSSSSPTPPTPTL